VLLLREDSGFDDDESRRQLLLSSLYLSNPNWQLGTPAPTHPMLVNSLSLSLFSCA